MKREPYQQQKHLLDKDRSEQFMKSAVSKKMAQVMATLLIISVLLPVLAFAAPAFNNDLTYHDNSVSGSVYLDTYNSNVQVKMFDPNGNFIGTTTASTYAATNGGYSYNFSSPTSSNYSYLKLQEVSSSVYGIVYDSTSSRRNGGGGGGGGYFPGTGNTQEGTTITVGADGVIDAAMLENALNSNDVVTIKLSGEFCLIPAKALVKFVGNKNKMLKILNDLGTYNLPLFVLNLTDLAGKLSTTVDDLRIKVTIAAATANDGDINSAASALGATVIAKAVDFGLVGITTDNKTQLVDLANNYISRIIPLSKTVDPKTATAVVLDPGTKKMSFVPATFTSDASGKSEANIKRSSNSIYTVIEMNKNFADSKGHWAQSYIDLLANKLVIDGVTDTTFEPERSITRAEFAALVVRSLGLEQKSGSAQFKDVSSSDWFSGVVSAAVYAKIIDGYEDNTFRPNQSINREELAAMVVRALAYAGAKPDVSSSRQSELLGKFADANSIVWAKQELAVAVEAGIVEGMTDTTIVPTMQATRAQSATMLKRFLTRANFING
jgi:N-acetylmuramoyl-L-alanine amidase